MFCLASPRTVRPGIYGEGSSMRAGTIHGQGAWMRMAAWMLLALMLSGPQAARAASMNPKLLPNVQASTFEVVAAKPGHDPLTYARKLPMDLLPYQERTDKYYSIGTAFAIGPNRYVTAGHVLMVGLDSLWGPLALRDASGKVLPDRHRSRNSRCAGTSWCSRSSTRPAQAALPVNTDPQLNTVVYAVGNALGTGRGDPRRPVHLRHARAAGGQLEVDALLGRRLAGQQRRPAAGHPGPRDRRGADEVGQREPQLRAADRPGARRTQATRP